MSAHIPKTEGPNPKGQNPEQKGQNPEQKGMFGFRPPLTL
jgi:hypothetical protein